LLNSIILIGRLVRDPELRYTSNGKPFSYFTLAVDRNYKNSEGEKETDFINVVAWGKLAEHCAHYLVKGRLSAVKGQLQIRKNKQEGRTYVNPEVIADQVQFLEWAKKDEQKDSNQHNKGQSNDDYNPDNFEAPF
jgi:single-strand DNA-binding protein